MYHGARDAHRRVSAAILKADGGPLEELCEQLPLLTNRAATVRTTHRAGDTRGSIAPPRSDCTPKFVPGNGGVVRRNFAEYALESVARSESNP